MKNNIKKIITLLSLSLVLEGCVDDVELKSFYKMSCDELMTKQVDLKDDIDSSSFGAVLEAIISDNDTSNNSQREENSLRRDLRDVQRAIYDRKCDWENTK